MLERITIGRDHCGFCGNWGLVAYLDAVIPPGRKVDVAICERCARAVPKAAELLKTIRAAKSPKAKKPPSKARKSRPAHPSANADPSDESEHGPVLGDRELAEREL